MTDRYLTAEEFSDALAETSHTMVGSVEGSDLGTVHQRVTRIELQLSNGRRIEITTDTNIDHEPEILISEVTS